MRTKRWWLTLPCWGAALACADPITCELLARPLPQENGYTWTLTSRLGDALRMAESLYGERDRSWTILGVEFSGAGPPQVWYPGSFNGRRDVIVQLTRSAASNEVQALFQLAHEVIHLLAPSGRPDTATVFEEGLASHFSLRYVAAAKGIHLDPETWFAHAKYRAAYRLVQSRYDAYPEADTLVRQLRAATGGSLSAGVTPDLLQRLFPKLRDEDARTLATKFVEWTPSNSPPAGAAPHTAAP